MQKRCASNLRIHFTLTPTHMGTKTQTAVVSTLKQNFFYILSRFYDFLIKLTLTGA